MRILDLLAYARYLPKELFVSPKTSTFEPSSGVLTGDIRHPHSDAPLPVLRGYYEELFAAFGEQHWWPGRTRFEVIVGAILVQNTSWSNVEPAIRNLQRARLLTPKAIERVSFKRLAQHIRSSGYFRQKARTLKAFVSLVASDYGGSLARVFRVPTKTLREQLLAVRGIGPETADSILLYAGKHAVFVVDAYTRRLLERHGLASKKDSYEEIRHFFETSLPPDAPLFNEFHALIVHTGKRYCRPQNPRCGECPLSSFLSDGVAS